jgi:hypothetical protein
MTIEAECACLTKRRAPGRVALGQYLLSSWHDAGLRLRRHLPLQCADDGGAIYG